jgi:hypothetical protein
MHLKVLRKHGCVLWESWIGQYVLAKIKVVFGEVVRYLNKETIDLDKHFDTPPSSLMDSTANPKVKTTEEERIEARSLVHNISRVEGHAKALGWD